MNGKRMVVLVVDDDAGIRKLVQHYLGALDMDVVEAADGKTALQKLSVDGIDLVFLDLMLPEASGYDVCDFIRNSSSHKDVPVLMMSARSLPEDRAQAEELGADAYIVKPFSRRGFVDQVQDVLSRMRGQRKEV